MKYFLLLVMFLNTLILAESRFLMPEEAFKASVEMKKSYIASVTIELGEDIYLYRSKITVKVLEANSGIIVDRFVLPDAIDHEGEKVYTSSPTFDIPLVKTKEMKDVVPITLIVGYQGCSEEGLCYEPIESKFTFDIQSSKLPLRVSAKTSLKNTISGDVKSPITVSETDRITQTFIEGNRPLILLTFFTFGLLLSLTP
ncbi:MAG: protein-disulfide reductase DsbD N-terminal domain-containing protein, partial [Sulfurimonas sp.]|nr:protein-disulfide reductase DsbD N-terminal domain-containing protein [Sulfurimonas sp.]